MAQDWDIKPRASQCGACQGAFEDRKPYYSSLVFGEGEGYVRRDFCDACWAARRREGQPEYSVWQGLYRAPPPPAEEALKKESAEDLLRKLMEDHEPARANVIYILAVMLERKKVLIERDVQIHEGVMTRAYEHRRTGETFLIVDPRLHVNDLEHVQTEVVTLLGGRKPGEAAPPAAPAPPAEAAPAP